MLILTAEERALIKTVLENAKAEVDTAANPDAVIQPDDPMSLMSHYDRATATLKKLEAYEVTSILVTDSLRCIESCPRCRSCPEVARDLLRLFDQT